MPSSVDDILAHAGVYDPTARRQRYLRDRELKGRGPGQPPPGGQSSNGSSSGGGSSGSGSVLSLHTKANQAVSATRQAAALRARLTTLRSALEKLLAEAKSGSSSTSSSSSKKGGSEDKSKGPDKPQTAKQKAAAENALKKAQEERAKQQKAEPDKKEAPSKEEQIAHLRSVIKDVESKLRAVLDRARPQTASNGR
mgnify:CR=1 FL=1